MVVSAKCCEESLNLHLLKFYVTKWPGYDNVIQALLGGKLACNCFFFYMYGLVKGIITFIISRFAYIGSKHESLRATFSPLKFHVTSYDYSKQLI